MTHVKRARVARRVTAALGLLALCWCGALKVAGQGTAAPPPAAPPITRLALPGRDWALDLSLRGFNNLIDSFDTEARGQRRMFIVTHAGPKKLMLLVRMSPAQRGGGDGRAFRDYLVASAKKNGVGTANWKVFEYAGLPLLKYRANLPFMPGMPVILPGGVRLSDPTLFPRMHNLSAFLGHDGVWVEITLMAESVGEKEEQSFYAVLDTVKVVDTSAPATSFDYFHKGFPIYVTGGQREALEFYRRALELERQERRLDTATWRLLVEQTATSYAVIADLEAAARTVEYGLSREPANPIFHFFMSVIQASRGNLDATVDSLQQAFQHKAALPAGQRLPDPRQHPSFQRFAKDEKFQQATKGMKP